MQAILANVSTYCCCVILRVSDSALDGSITNVDSLHTIPMTRTMQSMDAQSWFLFGAVCIRGPFLQGRKQLLSTEACRCKVCTEFNVSLQRQCIGHVFHSTSPQFTHCDKVLRELMVTRH